jgi:hypothetical protein
MRGKKIYHLEVPVLTQDLLNIKWALRSSLVGLVTQKMKVTEQPHNLPERLQLVKIGWTCLTNAVRKTISSSSSQLPRPRAITSCRSVVPLTFAAWRS